ncbi:MAG: protein kinase [Myxococcota bacterium]
MKAQISAKHAVTDPLIGLVIGGRYQLLHRLASGGMGSVYAGRAIGAGGFERRLAIKRLHPHLAEREKFVAMFLDEARLAARIHHPNVVPTLDVFAADGSYYLIMEYVEGMELGRLLAEAVEHSTKVPVRVLMRIILDALAGLAAAHALTDKNGVPLNLVHRDISPQNILVGIDGVARLTDFGVAKAEDRLHVTVGEEFKGKLAYASPEQLEYTKVGQQADLFSLGVVLFEALTHRRLFRGDDARTVREMVLSGSYPTVSEFEIGLSLFDEIVAKAMARSPESRVQSAVSLSRELSAVANRSVGIAESLEVAEWLRRLGAEYLDQRATTLRRAESTVEYPSSAGPLIPREIDVEPTDQLTRRVSTKVLASDGREEERSPDQVSYTAPRGTASLAGQDDGSVAAPPAPYAPAPSAPGPHPPYAGATGPMNYPQGPTSQPGSEYPASHPGGSYPAAGLQPSSHPGHAGPGEPHAGPGSYAGAGSYPGAGAYAGAGSHPGAASAAEYSAAGYSARPAPSHGAYPAPAEEPAEAVPSLDAGSGPARTSAIPWIIAAAFGGLAFLILIGAAFVMWDRPAEPQPNVGAGEAPSIRTPTSGETSPAITSANGAEEDSSEESERDTEGNDTGDVPEPADGASEALTEAAPEDAVDEAPRMVRPVRERDRPPHTTVSESMATTMAAPMDTRPPPDPPSAMESDGILDNPYRNR